MSKLLVADIGGTGTRLAVFQDGRQIAAPVTYLNSEHESFEAILDDFIARTECASAQAAFAVAGPVCDNAVELTNLGWRLSGASLAKRFGLTRVSLINDFAALAWATLSLKASDLYQVGGGDAVSFGNRGILGPGTGLGVSGLVHHAGGWAVIAGEGGHVTMPAGSQDEARLIQEVTAEFGHCSAERLTSGPGLAHIFGYVGGGEAAPETVTRLALAGDATALRAVELFSLMLGTVASNLALTLGAQGGIYLAGGILPAICPLFANSGFRNRFEAKGRFASYLAAIPTYVVTAEYPGLKGLEVYMREWAVKKSPD